MTCNILMQFVRLASQIDPPLYASSGAAGLDLRAAESVVIPGRESRLIRTGLRVALQPGTVGNIRSRSGLAVRKHLEVGAGIIDADYRGEICVLLRNHGDQEQHVESNERIAQMIVQPCLRVPLEEVDDLSETTRGIGGFGSTGHA